MPLKKDTICCKNGNHKVNLMDYPLGVGFRFPIYNYYGKVMNKNRILKCSICGFYIMEISTRTIIDIH